MRLHRVFVISVLISISQLMLGEIVTYQPDNTTNFCNPERGFYYHSEQKVTTSGATNLSSSTFSTARNAGSSLLLRLYYLNNFRKDDLPQAVLDQINNDFDMFRTNGCKAVLRFAYTADNDNWPYKDGSPAIWKSHLAQLKPILQANADVIAVVQAGFMGAWGEWYFSSQGEGSEIPQKVKNDLIDELLDAVPASRSVQLRTPDYKRDYFTYRKESTSALTSAEAYTGTARARLGHHNDAFLYQDDNMGTYSDRETDMAYLAQECLFLPNGGETDVYKEYVYQGWATGDKAQAEMAQLHYSYLNNGYAELTLSHWREDGTFDILSRNMGYRFQLVETTIPSTASTRDKLPVQLLIRNTGYATPFNSRSAYLVFRSGISTYIRTLNTDPRRWLPNGAITQITDTISLADMPNGNYEVCLWLPDPYTSIEKDPRFAIRLANEGVWEEKTGYNKLLTTLSISTDGEMEETDTDMKPQADVEPITNLTAIPGNGCASLSWNNPKVTYSSYTDAIDLTTGVDTTYNEGNNSSSATIVYDGATTKVNYATNNDWLWAGVSYPVDSLTEITTIQFEYKGDGSPNCLLAYAGDGTYRWGDAECLPLDSTQWQSITLTPSKAIWEQGMTSYDFGHRPITSIGFIANPKEASYGSFSIRNVQVTRVHNPKSDFASLRIIRKEGSMSTSFEDGILMYYGNETSCTDVGLIPGKTYYYAAYAVDSKGRLAFPATCKVTIEGTRLDEVIKSPSMNTQKIMYNGQILILQNGKVYNALGQVIAQ